MDVKNGNREDQTPSQTADPARDPAPRPSRPSADDMIGPVDGFEERLEMSRRPGLDGRGDQHEGKREIVEGVPHCVVQPCAGSVEEDSPSRDRAPGGL